MKPAPDRPRILVAGAGNWLLGEDRIGPRMLEAVSLRYGGDVELVDIGTTALALLDRLDAQDLVIVVDACVGIGRPGSILVTEPDPLLTGGPSTSIHQIGPLEALAVARELDRGRMPERVVLILVETAGLDALRETEVVARVTEVLDGIIAETAGAAVCTGEVERRAS
jgi:hydrogenase maturation protease